MLDGAFPFHLALPTAAWTAFPDDLPGSLARRTRPRNAEETLLVTQLPAPAAGLAGGHSAPRLRAGAVARLAELQPRELDLGDHTGSRFLEGERHVVPEIAAPLRSAAAPSSSATEDVFEAKKIAQNVLEVLEDRGVNPAGLKAHPRQSGVAVPVVHFALLWIAQHAVSFRGVAKTSLGFPLVRRIAVGVPLQRCLPVRGLDFFLRRRAAYAQHLVEVP